MNFFTRIISNFKYKCPPPGLKTPGKQFIFVTFVNSTCEVVGTIARYYTHYHTPCTRNLSDNARGRVLARLRVWDAMLCNVDAQTSKFSFSKGSRFFSLDPMKLTAKRKPIYCFFHAMNCIPFFFLMIFLWHDLKMWKSSLNHLRKKPKRSLYFLPASAKFGSLHTLSDPADKR